MKQERWKEQTKNKREIIKQKDKKDKKKKENKRGKENRIK